MAGLYEASVRLEQIIETMEVLLDKKTMRRIRLGESRYHKKSYVVARDAEGMLKVLSFFLNHAVVFLRGGLQETLQGNCAVHGGRASHARPDEGGRLEQGYMSRSKSSAVRFACLRMDLKVPFASSRCIGTMTINTSSARRLFSLT